MKDAALPAAITPAEAIRRSSERFVPVFDGRRWWIRDNERRALVALPSRERPFTEAEINLECERARKAHALRLLGVEFWRFNYRPLLDLSVEDAIAALHQWRDAGLTGWERPVETPETNPSDEAPGEPPERS